jgi:hypothetical protein
LSCLASGDCANAIRKLSHMNCFLRLH